MPKIILNDSAESIKYLCKKDKRLKKVIGLVGDITYELHENGYEFLIHKIVEQMLSIKAAAKIFERLQILCNNNITIQTFDGLTDEQIKSVGISSGKVSYIRALNAAIKDNVLDLNELSSMSDLDIIAHITKVKGIGNWTAKMYLIFVLDRPNVLPYEDVAFLQSYKWMFQTDNIDKDMVVKKCKKWSPYSTIAARYLYRALDMRLTKNPFNSYD